MKSLRLYRPGQLEFVNISEPVIKSDSDVKIAVRFGAIQTDDFNIYSGKMGQTYSDFGLFHEVTGEVVEVGSRAKYMGFSVGDRVATSPFNPCGACPACRSGRLNLCSETVSDGMMAEYVVVSYRRLYKIPGEISLKDGCLTWLSLNCARCIERLEMLPGQSVLILGAGSAGQMILQMAKHRMPSLLVISDPMANKRALAKKNGADVVIDPISENLYTDSLKLTNGAGYDYIIDAAGDITELQNSIDLLSRGGKCMIFASYGVSSHLNLYLPDMYWKECQIMTQYGTAFSPYSQQDTKILTRLSLDSMIDKVYPLEDVEKAFEDYATKKYLRILVEV